MTLELLLDVTRDYRLRSGASYTGGSRDFIGAIISMRRHDSNQRAMYQLAFFRHEHQTMFGHTYFYGDDLEVVNNG